MEFLESPLPFNNYWDDELAEKQEQSQDNTIEINNVPSSSHSCNCNLCCFSNNKSASVSGNLSCTPDVPMLNPTQIGAMRSDTAVDIGIDATPSLSSGITTLKEKSFIKRMINLKKKLFEFSTLCDVQTCMVAFTPDGQLYTWPDQHTQICSTIYKYQHFCREDKKNKATKPKLDFSTTEEVAPSKKKRRLDNQTLCNPISSSAPTEAVSLIGS